jgi:hypothetical protein
MKDSHPSRSRWRAAAWRTLRPPGSVDTSTSSPSCHEFRIFTIALPRPGCGCLLVLEEVPEVIHITFPFSHCGWGLAPQNMCLCFWNNVTPGAFCMILILPFQKDLQRGEVTRYVLSMPLTKTRRKSLACLCCSVPLNMGLSSLGMLSTNSPVRKCPFSKRPCVQVLH